MTQSVLVVGHADADGHLIAEQVSRNLSLIDSFDVNTVVDPERTKDHRAWLHLDAITEIETADTVFFVDMMFAPSTFAEEAKALVEFVKARPDKRFFLIDHHPLPLRRLEAAENLRVAYRPEVFECAIGPRSGMMVVAALCEGQHSDVAGITKPMHEVLALGMRRAAALGGELPGERLLALLRSDCWSKLAKLGEEPRDAHRLPRGRRPLDDPKSAALRDLEKAANKLMADAERPHSTGGVGAMAYDLDVAQERFIAEGGQRVRITNAPANARDLETIMTLLEVAALSLTNVAGATFTHDQLLREARKLGGENIDLRDEDVDIVLKKQGFLTRSGKELRLR